MSEPLNLNSELFEWQTDLWQQLQNQVEQKRLPHALLFAGPSGVGKWQFAERFVAGWMCENSQQGEACGECRHCKLMAAGTHPDVVIPQRDPKKKSDQLGVDEIRQLVEFCSQTAQLGGRKVVLIPRAAGMTTSAQNALLKTLEEPGKDTLLVLVANHPELMLPTIRSRCQQYWFTVPKRTKLLVWLQQQQIDEVTAEAAAAATGAPLLALELAQSDWFADRANWAKVLLSVAGGQVALTVAAKTLEKLPAYSLFDVLMHWCHYSLRARFLNQPVSDAALKAMQDLTQIMGEKGISNWYLALRQAHSRLARSANLQPALQLTQLLWLLTPHGIATSLNKK